MTRTRIKLSGCDDSTVVTADLSADERSFLDRLAARFDEAGSGGCKPSMAVEDARELCAACKPGGRCTDDYAEEDGYDCSTAIGERVPSSPAVQPRDGEAPF